MAARPYWKGHMRLSLVTFPVHLYTAVETNERVSLHQLHKPSMERIRYQKVVPDLGPVPKEEIVKGYEYEKDEYVLLEEAELDELKLESNHTIELVQFVRSDEIDVIYYERPYFVVPEKGIGEPAFRIVRDAMRQTRKVALGQVVLANRERIAAVRPCGDGLLLETLRYADEIRDVEDYFKQSGKDAHDDEQVELALQIMQRRTKPFSSEAFRDHYQEALRELVQAKIAGKLAKGKAGKPKRGEVIDLTEALRRSLGRGEATPEPAAAEAPKSGRKTKPATPAAGGRTRKRPSAA